MPTKPLPVDKKAVKALVALFGPREAARQAGIAEGTVLWWCSKFKWKKAIADNSMKDAGDMISESMQRSKQLSTVHLAKFAERAAIEAAEHERPLEITKQAKDIASVHSVLWPHDNKSGMIEGAILIGGAVVTDEKPAPQTNQPIIDAESEVIREELSDS